MIWNRLRKSTRKEEDDFQERMQDVPLVDKLVMIGTAFVWIVLPCLAVIIGMCLLVMWLLRML